MTTPASGPSRKTLPRDFRDRAGQARRSALSREHGHGHQHHRQHHHVVEPALHPEHGARGRWNPALPEQPADHDGIGGGECGAQDRGRGPRQVEQPVRRHRDEHGGEQRAGAQHRECQLEMPPELGAIDRHGVGEEHQHQAQCGHHRQDGRAVFERHQPETVGPEHGAETEEEQLRGGGRLFRRSQTTLPRPG